MKGFVAVVLALLVFVLGPSRVLLVVAGLAVALLLFFKLLMDRMFFSIPIVPSSPAWRVDESQCSLFKFLPQLRGKVAWRPLGVFPTPVHHFTLELENGRDVQFLAKREDLSSDFYGGNKVRTLEFQLACAAAHAETIGVKDVYVLGASGSNQVVAVAAHVRKSYNRDLVVHPCFALPEAATLENGLNAYSAVSLLNSLSRPSWLFRCLPVLVQKLFLSPRTPQIVIPPGGANISGALGHIAAVLEVASMTKDIEHIVLPQGSGCTTAGILLGIAIAQHLGLGFQNFKCLHSVCIHPVAKIFGGLLPRKVVNQVVAETAKKIAELGGPDIRVSVEELKSRCWRLLRTHTGEYGEPTKSSLVARNLPLKVQEGVKPWLCHTFSSKALGYLAESLANGAIPDGEKVLFWCTKTLTQPAVGKIDVFGDKEHCPVEVISYIRECKISSSDDFFSNVYSKIVE